MFVGHFTVAFALILLFPQVPIWVPLVGVSFPDLLWGVLILARKEEVIVDRTSSSHESIQFKSYPYSHSLVLTNAISFAIGGVIALALGIAAALPVFVLASASHWILDVVVHLRDLPVLGFDGDKKVGLGLWRWGKTAFSAELVFFAISAVAFVRSPALLSVIVVGVVFHVINLNSFVGSGRRNLFPTPGSYAAAALAGFGALTAAFWYLL